MDQECIRKAILSGIVDRYIVEIANDPHRAIRKLVDIAEQTSDGPTQKICYQMMQQMASDQASPYYEMIHHMVTHTNPETVKHFGINLGHTAWTVGSGNIRRLISDNNTFISWTALIDRRPTDDLIPFTEITDMVSRGRKLDACTWILMTSGPLSEWEKYTDLFRLHKDCAFGLCLDPAALTETVLEEASEIPNLMVLLCTDEPDWQPAAEELERKGCLFSVYRRVRDAEQVKEIISGAWLDEVSPWHPLMAFSFTDDHCPEESSLTISRYMWDTRLEQLYPVLPVDLNADFLTISRLVTHTEVLYRIEPDGSVSESRSLFFQPTSLHIHDLFVTGIRQYAVRDRMTDLS